MEKDNAYAEALELARQKMLKQLLVEERVKECCTITPRKELIKVNSVEEFKKAISTCKVAVGFFYSPTCRYCRMMEPLIREAASLLGDRVAFFKVNVVDFMELAYSYYIMGTPTLIAFKRGREADRLIGLVPVEVLEEFLVNLLRSEGCPLPGAEAEEQNE